LPCVPQAAHQLPSSRYSTPLPTCYKPIHLSLSSPWIFPRYLTPSNTPHCCPRWLLSTVYGHFGSRTFRQQRNTTEVSGNPLDLPTPVYNWLVDIFGSHSRHTVFSAYKKRHGKYHTGLGRGLSRLYCHSRRSQSAQQRQHIH